MPDLVELFCRLDIMQMATLQPQGSVASNGREPERVTPEVRAPSLVRGRWPFW
jgi:hypothetical protein